MNGDPPSDGMVDMACAGSGLPSSMRSMGTMPCSTGSGAACAWACIAAIAARINRMRMKRFSIQGSTCQCAAGTLTPRRTDSNRNTTIETTPTPAA